MVIESAANSIQKRFHVLVIQDGAQEHQTAKKILSCFASHVHVIVRAMACTRNNASDYIQISAVEDDKFDDLSYELIRGIAHLRPDTILLSKWADLLVVAPIKADTIAKMLHGFSDSILLEILRSWDVSKKILMVPGMSTAMWENPMTKKQLNKIRRKWNWIRVLEPVLWGHSRGEVPAMTGWSGLEELAQNVENQADLMTIGREVDTVTGESSDLPSSDRPTNMQLPPEIWSIILQNVGDWEVAKSLGIYTTLPVPPEWQRPEITDVPRDFMKDLEWTILTGKHLDIIKHLRSGPPQKWLSRLCVKLVIKFGLTNLLSYLETHFFDLFWYSFGHTLLPDKASAVFGRTCVLEWWRTSPSFLNKEYTSEAIDGASKAGFIQVLDWWRDSGLALRYTEAALEQASSKGRTDVLEWWHKASLHHGSQRIDDSDSSHQRGGSPRLRRSTTWPNPSAVAPQYDVDSHSGLPQPIPLKVGKSLIFAAQNGQALAVRWWATSGVPLLHEESVPKLASAAGHVEVLQVWKELKGDKMNFDNQVLVAATKNGHAEVLEWWRRSDFRVEYKTCDIEEALEDSLGGEGERKVRGWWARNGLNLGVGTSEWMKVKVL
ncbi:Flavoprotein [Lasallia pustulata]|uniref:Flavoprotein n=1 Tax=Lasallia pustulata TaxID=136370 RepID=A0A1W5CT82_9LECA|nr:Flavoprotein [Lasallia pustulata]